MAVAELSNVGCFRVLFALACTCCSSTDTAGILLCCLVFPQCPFRVLFFGCSTRSARKRYVSQKSPRIYRCSIVQSREIRSRNACSIAISPPKCQRGTDWALEFFVTFKECLQHCNQPPKNANGALTGPWNFLFCFAVALSDVVLRRNSDVAPRQALGAPDIELQWPCAHAAHSQEGALLLGSSRATTQATPRNA